MVWQHDKVNRLMDHQTNVGGGRRRGEGRRGERRAVCEGTTGDGRA